MAGCLFIPGKVEGKQVQFLVDTGCSHSLLSKVVFDRLPRKVRETLQGREATAALADGSGLHIYGSIILKGRLRNVTFREEFLVSRISDEAIIGMSFLRRQECTLDCDRGILVMGSETIPCVNKAGRLLANKVQVLRQTVLAPGKEAQLHCRLTTSPSGPVGLVENHLKGDQGIAIAATLCQPGSDGKLVVRCINTTDKSLEMQAGSVVGLYQPVEPEQVVEAEAETSGSSTGLGIAMDLPAHLVQLFQGAQPMCTSIEQEGRLQKLLVDYADVFSSGEDDVGLTNLVQHSIPLLPGTDPIRQPPRRLGPEKDLEVERQVSKLVHQGLVEPADSGWSSPVVLVHKKDGSWRLCCDYRRLNAVTRRDAFPLPRIDDSLDSLAGSVYFSTLDLLSGYWQVPLSREAQDKAAFVTRGGLWRWKVLPFGLTSAPATFERLMEQVLKGLQWKTLLLYLDDVIIFSRDFESHMDRLAVVLDRFRSANLKLKPSKCELLRREVRYLGHVVSEEGIATDPDKVVAVKEWKQPTCVQEVRAFLGFVGYYRRFFQNFAAEARPLNRLTSATESFRWSEAEENAFQALKAKVITAPVLAYPKAGAQYILDTDASLDGAGAVLSQVQEGEERVVAYYSKTFSPPQRNYCVTRRELLAVILAVGHFRPYLYGQKFKLRTDHASLLWLYKRSEPSHQVARWLEALAEFNFTMEHRPGSKHLNADGMSRCGGDCKQCTRIEERDGGPSRSELGQEPEVECETFPPGRVPASAGSVQLTSQVTEQELAKQQRAAGTDTATIIRCVEDGTTLTSNELDQASHELKRLNALLPFMRLQQQALQAEVIVGRRKRWCTICPVTFRQPVIWEIHQSHHSGINKTLRRIRMTWYWPGMVADVRRMVRTCEVCQAAKHSRTTSSGNRQRLYAGRPWQVVSVDLVGPFPETPRGNTTILVLTDHFTRWRDAIPLVDGTAEVVAHALEHRVFCYLGLPERVHTDQGAQFESKLMHELCQLWGVEKSRTTPYRPQANGVVERGNRDLGDALRALLLGGSEDDWDLLLPQLMRSFRATPHASTEETANFMMFGRELRLPDQLVHGSAPPDTTTRAQYACDMRDRLQQAYEALRGQQQQIRSADKQEEPLFVVGEKVWLQAKRFTKGKAKKLQPKYVGPYNILEVNSNHTYLIEQKGRASVESESRLKPYMPAIHPDGRVPALAEPSRQPTRQGMAGVQPKRLVTSGPPVCVNHDLQQRRDNLEASQDSSESDTPGDTDTSQTAPDPQTQTGTSASDASTATSDDGPCSLDRPRRARNLPPRLADFELSSVDIQVTANKVQFGNSQQSDRMAQKLLELEVLDLHEEGELSDDMSSDVENMAPEVTARKEDTKISSNLTLTGSTVDDCHLSSKTVDTITYLFRQCNPYGGCYKKGCSYASRVPERLQIHLEQHYIVYAWECGFLSSNRDSVLKHGRRKHKGSGVGIIQFDNDNWKEMVESGKVKGLPTECPALPMVFKPSHLPCLPKYKKRPAESGSTLQVKVSRVEVGREVSQDAGTSTQPDYGRDEVYEEQLAVDEERPASSLSRNSVNTVIRGDARGPIVISHLPSPDIVRAAPTLMRSPLVLRKIIQEKTERARDLRRIAAEIDLEADEVREELVRRENCDTTMAPKPYTALP